MIGRPRGSTVLVASLATLLLIGLLAPAAAAAKSPPGLDAFMRGLASVESGGRYTARNGDSGAYGKYQILPSMWRAWARRYFGRPTLRPTPANQEKLARAVITRAYQRYGSWPVVAYYWLTGRGLRDRHAWSPYGRRYVAKVMAAYRRYGGASGAATGGSGSASHGSPTTTAIAETSSAIRYAGGWGTASYPGYAGGHVRWSTAAGATATLTFTGTQVTWVGPKGPTRGRARISIDGLAIGVVDLYAPRFVASASLFSTSFATAGTHRLTIEVLSMPRRPFVAIDRFLVRR